MWDFADTIAPLFQKWHVFQVVYDGHQPEYPGDFTSVEQTVDEAAKYLNVYGILRWDGAYGCAVGGACLTRLPAFGRKIACRYGGEEKKERKRDVQFIRRYFPQAHIHGIPKMAHAELVTVHPEDFCRYAEKFLIASKENV